MKQVAAVLLLLGMSLGAHAATLGPAATVDAFHLALHAQDGKAAVALLAPEAVVFEQGFYEASRDDYEKSSLADDMKFAATTTREVQSREAIVNGDVAWVQSLTRTRGKFGESAVDLSGAETMILRRSGDAWKIVHIHWSAHDTVLRPPAAPEKK